MDFGAWICICIQNQHGVGLGDVGMKWSTESKRCGRQVLCFTADKQHSADQETKYL